MQSFTNLSYLEDFTNNDPELIREGISVYLQRSPELLKKLILSTKSKDWKGIHDSAHSLFSSTQIVGISSIAQTIKEVESSSRAQVNYETITEQVHLIETALVASFEELNHYLEQNQAKI